MSKILGRCTGYALLALLATAAVALAAGPKKGATYTGATVRGKEPITLKVSSSGRAVTASVVFPPLYCEGGGGGTRQITKPAAISKSGGFSATIAYEFIPAHKVVTKLYVSGRFSGKTVKGSARSEFGLLSAEALRSLKRCDGSTSFAARTK
jgi:hypothetical protein